MAVLYCDVARAKRFSQLISYKDLGLADEDEYTEHVEDIIRTASRLIDHHCKRPDDFFNTTAGVTITEYADGRAERPTRYYQLTERDDNYDAYRATFWLEQTPILSITSVHENEADLGETANWSEITKYVHNTSTGELRFKSSVVPDEGTKNIRFIYKAGYATTPEAVQMACALLVSHYLQNFMQHDLTQRTNWGRPAPMDFQRPEVFTQDIKDLLAPYVKKRAHIG